MTAASAPPEGRGRGSELSMQSHGCSSPRGLPRGLSSSNQKVSAGVFKFTRSALAHLTKEGAEAKVNALLKVILCSAEG